MLSIPRYEAKTVSYTRDELISFLHWLNLAHGEGVTRVILQRSIDLTKKQCDDFCNSLIAKEPPEAIEVNGKIRLAERFFDQRHYSELRPVKPPCPIEIEIPKLNALQFAVLACLCDGMEGNKNIAEAVTKKVPRDIGKPYAPATMPGVIRELRVLFQAKNSRHLVALATQIGIQNFQID